MTSGTLGHNITNNHCVGEVLLQVLLTQVVDEETVDSPPLAGGALQRAPTPLPFSLGDGAMLDLSLKGG